MNDTVLMIGAGGAAQWLIKAMAKSPGVFPFQYLTVLDRDTIETRNLERQDFRRTDVGKGKAEALVEAPYAKDLRKKVGLSAENKWFNEEELEAWAKLDEHLIVVSATDNFPARSLALDLVDRRPFGSTILFSPGNGFDTEEAYVYLKEWKNHPVQDPRIRFPEHLTDKTDDPLSPPCDASEVVEATPQLALANMGGAYLCLKLMYFWLNKVPSLLANTEESLQTKLKSTFPFRYHAGAGFIVPEKIQEGTL